MAERQIVIVLGAPNSPTGELSTIAKDRLDKAREVLDQRPGAFLLLTGGFGEHFNTSDEPHFLHSRRYLLARGVDEKRILDHGIESRSTIEDAELSYNFLQASIPPIVTVVTSDFHAPRAREHFTSVFGPGRVELVVAESSVDASELSRLIADEARG